MSRFISRLVGAAVALSTLSVSIGPIVQNGYWDGI
jgi:hypothetical protein